MKLHEDIYAEVKDLIATSLAISEDIITEESSIEDLSADSIQLFELLLAFEKKYHIETSYDDVIKLQTVGDIVAYVGKTAYGAE